MSIWSRSALIASSIIGATAAQAQVDAAPVRRLDFGASIQSVYNSNISQTSEELARLRGLSRDDVRVTPALTVDLSVPIGRQSLTLLGSAGYDFYNSNTRLNAERIGLDGIAGLRLGGCDGSVSASYARRQSELGDLFFLLDDGQLDFRRRVRNVEDVKTIGISGSCGDSIGLRPTASFEQSWVDNSQDLRRIADYDRTAVSAGVAYARPSFGLLTLFGSYSTTTFPNRGVLVGLPDGNDSFETKGGGIRYERSIGSRIRGLAEVSYTSTDSRRAVSDFSGITWRGQITHTVNPQLQWMFDISRAVLPSNRVDANYSVDQFYAFNANYRLTERLTLRANASYRDRDYKGGFLAPGAFFGPRLVNDNFYSFTLGADQQLYRTFRFTLSATQERRNANGNLYDYAGTRLLAGVASTF